MLYFIEKAHLATLLYYVACLVQNTHITASAIEQIDLDMLKRDEVIRCADATLAVFCSLGGTDKVAKNREFTEALLSAINQELSNALQQRPIPVTGLAFVHH